MTKKTKKSILLLLPLLLAGIFNTVSAADTYTSKSEIEKIYNETSGYTSVSQAVQMFEAKYKKKVELPTEFPFKVVLQKAKFESTGQKLKICYFGLKSTDTLIIYVESNSRTINPNSTNTRVTLSDGTLGIYRENQYSPYLIEFRRNNLYYLMGIGRSTKEQISADVMLRIANSIPLVK